MPGDKTQSEVSRVNAEAGRRDAEDLRQEADKDRDSAEGHRVLATADALSANLAQMQFLEDARNTFRQLKATKPSDVQ